MSILLVDDDPLVLLTMAALLEDAGLVVVTAADGVDAVSVIVREGARFTALVTDFHMPRGMNGADLVDHMRPLYPEIPMVIATALPDAVDLAWARQNAVRVLAKPYSASALLSLLGVRSAGRSEAR